MKYFEFRAGIPARKEGNNVPEIYVKGEWKRFPKPEEFAYETEEISEEEFNKLIEDYDNL